MSVVEANLIITKTLFTIVYDSMEKQSFIRIFSSFYRFFRASNVNSQEDMSFFMGVEARHGKIIYNTSSGNKFICDFGAKKLFHP